MSQTDRETEKQSVCHNRETGMRKVRRRWQDNIYDLFVACVLRTHTHTHTHTYLHSCIYIYIYIYALTIVARGALSVPAAESEPNEKKKKTTIKSETMQNRTIQ